MDYATNLLSGKWHDTDLGKAYRAARDNPTRAYEAFFDFGAYGPSHGALASFIAAPVLSDSGRFLGVLAFQMPVDRLNNVLQEAEGLGKSGDTFLVGQDFLMRSDSRFAEQSTILARQVEMNSVMRALQGEHGVMTDLDSEGQQVIVAFAPLDFAGVRWALISKMNTEEILAPAQGLAWRILGITAFALIVLSCLGWILAQGIVQPLGSIISSVGAMARGEIVEIPGSNRSDEIGALARSMDAVYQKASRRRGYALRSTAVTRWLWSPSDHLHQRYAERLFQGSGGRDPKEFAQL